ncbi:MAG: glycoside hydrolase family 127 protein [Clostridia bacterium]|nr:glycoside hydrolase family 127 protein [Clostridia bacterium]
MENISLNFKRLCQDDYSPEQLFKPSTYDWPGDWEGRALLAFMCHYEINGSEVPGLHTFFSMIPERVNQYGYFGVPFDGATVDEQQFSGHNWYLRGLLKYARAFDSKIATELAKSTVENLYLPAISWYSHYPLERGEKGGDVSGSVTGVQNGWKLSSDIGCAFMCVDGLAHYYKETGDERVKNFLDEVIKLFVSVDLLKYNLQTHTTLTCLRGILTLYQSTGEKRYLDIVKDKFTYYTKHGMTLTYENFNWFGREDTWTEPCAVVDSFILATELYKVTKDAEYKTLSRRIWWCGMQFCQRENGGAGPNTCVKIGQPVLKISMYEAPFCCTMRYAEGLLEYANNSELFVWDGTKEMSVDELGRRFIDDKLIVSIRDKQMPIFSLNTVSMEEALAVEVKIF